MRSCRYEWKGVVGQKLCVKELEVYWCKNSFYGTITFEVIGQPAVDTAVPSCPEVQGAILRCSFGALCSAAQGILCLPLSVKGTARKLLEMTLATSGCRICDVSARSARSE